jgi:hypothetical protein
MAEAKIDEIGRWTKVKLDILKRYAAEYSKILSSQRNPPFFHVYIDAFAGAGYHLSKTTGEWVLGSPSTPFWCNLLFANITRSIWTGQNRRTR